MPRLVRPLYADTARGIVGGVLCYQMRPSGPAVGLIPTPGPSAEPAQRFMRCHFAAAHAAWMLQPLVPHPNPLGGSSPPIFYRDPRWPAYWRDYWNANRYQPCDGFAPDMPPPRFDGSYRFDGSLRYLP